MTQLLQGIEARRFTRLNFSIPSPFISFWEKHPALLLGIFLLIGTSFSFSTNLVDLFPASVLLWPFLKKQPNRKLLILALSLFFLGWASASFRCPQHALNDQVLEGKAHFSISSIKQYQSPFYRSIAYQGKLLHFEGSGGESLSSLPCQIYLPFSSKRPKANCDYEIRGRLQQKGPHHFVLKPQKKAEWVPIPSTHSLAELRYQAKRSVHSYLKKQITDHEAATFLSALATGAIDERSLSMEFNHLGIQHILAISGFHFALIAFFLNRLLQLSLSPKITAWLLLVLLTAYALFLGDSPSIQRAWIAAAVFLIGRTFNLRITALNALGIGLCVELLIDPSIISHLGFLLSFLCTLAILLLFPLFQTLFQFLLPIRPFKTVKAMPHLDQCGYIANSFLRQLLAMNLAIHIACLPVLLYLFHRFPLLSLVYNLFFPLWVSISLFLLCAACLLAYTLPPLGHLLHLINQKWTTFALATVQHPPATLDFVLRIKAIPYPALILFLTFLLTICIFLTEKHQLHRKMPL